MAKFIAKEYKHFTFSFNFKFNSNIIHLKMIIALSLYKSANITISNSKETMY